MNYPTTLSVTNQSIDLSGLSPETWVYFENLADSIINRYHTFGKERVVFALAGPGGAGKSVVSAILAYLLCHKVPDFEFINVSLDAYHYTNQTLIDRGLIGVKGRYDTYNISTLRSDLIDFKAGIPVQFPTYSRQLHEPIQQNLTCKSKNALLWLEGGWLLFPEGGWEELMTLYDYSFYISASERDVSKYIINRHVRGGRGLTDAKKFYAQSDVLNIRLVLQKSLPADETIRFWQNV